MTDDTHSEMDTERKRKVRSAISQAISHMKIIEPGLEPFDAGKNREARQDLGEALEILREREGR